MMRAFPPPRRIGPLLAIMAGALVAGLLVTPVLSSSPAVAQTALEPVLGCELDSDLASAGAPESNVGSQSSDLSAAVGALLAVSMTAPAASTESSLTALAEDKKCPYKNSYKGAPYSYTIRVRDGKLIVKFGDGVNCKIADVAPLAPAVKDKDDGSLSVPVKNGTAVLSAKVTLKCGDKTYVIDPFKFTYDEDANDVAVEDSGLKEVKSL